MDENDSKKIVLEALTFKNLHVHVKKHKLQGRFEDMTNYLNALGLTFLSRDAYTILNHKYGLTKPQFYHYRRKLTT